MGCKWHFEQDARHKAGQLPKELREAFINTCLRLHGSTTVWKFEKLLDELRVNCFLALCRRNSFDNPTSISLYTVWLLAGVYPGVSSLEVLGYLVGGPKEYDVRSLQVCKTAGGQSVRNRQCIPEHQICWQEHVPGSVPSQGHFGAGESSQDHHF